MKFLYLLTAGLTVAVFLFGLNFRGYNGFGLIIAAVEWTTLYILPWIALYWFIKFVKSKTVV